ncbi:N-6 DNA methylase [Candidatus Parcubacteria bacterium]|nr:N-6 DNA methylase [Candidatus Parcubacteria bacterium]
MSLPLNEIRARSAAFAERWKGVSSEQGERQSFWNEFFEIYGTDRKSVAIFESAVNRLGRAQGFIDLFWPGLVIVEHKSLGKPLDAAFDQAADYASFLPPKDHPRYIITSDFHSIRLYDLSAKDGPKHWEINLEELPKKADMFSFLGGYKKQEIIEEDPVNRKAAERFAELHDQLKSTGYSGHELEVLLVRILFCLFAEDSGIFERNQFHDLIYNGTDIYGNNLGPHLMQLFDVLNKPKDKRQSNLDENLNKFPYINGKLFEERIATPTFDYKMRDWLLETAHKLDWSSISPAIFGAMFQGVMEPKQRRSLGAHYTSEQNIMKVIKPLFLDDLWKEFENVKDNRSELLAFHDKISCLKFLDPACGCGNFLVVSYKELRRLELEIIKITCSVPGIEMKGLKVSLKSLTKCNVDQFYGIEIEEFPAQIAQVALWLTDVQMNNEAADYFGKPLVRLPLLNSATIINENALEADWHELVKPSQLDYLFGNPPFSGGKQMNQDQRDQIVELFPKGSGAGVLDFVAGWYVKAIDYIKDTQIKVAFVSTNSITQGEQVSILWQYLLDKGAKINFAHRTFRWNNEASGKAAVYCVIIGFWLKNEIDKTLYDYAEVNGEPHGTIVKNLNPYLIDGPNVIIKKRTNPMCNVPKMQFGNMPLDGGYLLLTTKEKSAFIESEPLAKDYIKKFIGAKEFLNRQTKWCLWLIGTTPDQLHKMPQVLKRVEEVKKFRLSSKALSTQKFASSPALFRDRNWPDSSIVVPRVSSENRRYIPMGFFDKNSIVGDTCMSIPNGNMFHFGVLESEMHMTWMRYVAGRLESRYRYSKDIVYNNFPWPKASSEEQKTIEQAAQNVLSIREKYPDSSLAHLYGPLTMPPDLFKAHQTLDQAVDKLYRKEKFIDEKDRMQFLLKNYQELTKSRKL